MRSGWFGGTIWLALLLSVFSCHGVGETLFVNGASFGSDLALIDEAGTVLAPLYGFDRVIGMEAEPFDGGARISLRWDGRRRILSRHDFPVIDGQVYANVERLVGWMGGSIHRIGDTVYVETDPAILTEFDLSDERIVLRFNGFVPDQVIVGSGSEWRVRFFHCTSGLGARSIVMAEGPVQEARLRATETGAVDLVVQLRNPSDMDVVRTLAEGFFSVSLGSAEEVGKETAAGLARETITRLGAGITLHETEIALSAGVTRVNAVTVDSWRDAFRLRPAIPSSGIGTESTILRLASEQAAGLAIDAGESIGVCVLDGVPVSIEPAEQPALCADLFGRLSVEPISADVQLWAGGRVIPIDDVNRPIAYGELMAYAPGYLGDIARGVPGTFTVIKLRAGRVVSIYQGGFVFEDTTATLIVASGEAKARLASLCLGDAARLETLDSDGRPIQQALAAGPVLSVDGLTQAEIEWGTINPQDSQAWSLLVLDWHGGLTLLSVVRDATSPGATGDEVLELLRTLPVPVRDTVVLNHGAASALVVPIGDALVELSGDGSYPIGLCLIPMTP